MKILNWILFVLFIAGLLVLTVYMGMSFAATENNLDMFVR